MEKTFKIATKEGLKEVQASPMTIAGEQCFATNDAGWWWEISHAETGMFIADGRTKKEAIASAKARIKTGSEAIEQGRKVCKHYGYELPVNPINQ